MNEAYVVRVRNVNHALKELVVRYADTRRWRSISPRGMATQEFRGIHITEYRSPCERVLFSPSRDINPFFHLMEALWIMDGRKDVAFLDKFNGKMKDYSDDGENFHAAYGYRMRYHYPRKDTRDPDNRTVPFESVDQLSEVIQLLKTEPDTRRAVINLWDPGLDLNVVSKDIPCNDTVFFKLRENQLDITVCCRSNDALWGAYGTNAVQFSFLQEFVACAIGARVGIYRQISDSFHIYDSLAPMWKKIRNEALDEVDPYIRHHVKTMPLMQHGENYLAWLTQNNMFLKGELSYYAGDPYPFFSHCAAPIMHAWEQYKHDIYRSKNDRIDAAIEYISEWCKAEDWASACIAWLRRRREA